MWSFGQYRLGRKVVGVKNRKNGRGHDRFGRICGRPRSFTPWNRYDWKRLA